MAAGARLRSNFHEGTLSAPLGDNAGGTDHTISSAEFAGLPAISGGEYYLPMTIGNEIVHVTGHVATETTVVAERGKEGTTATSHGTGTAWEHAPTAQDLHEGYASDVSKNSGTALTIDIGQASMWTVTLDANCTFTFTGSQDTGVWSLTLVLTQDATGSRTVTWPTSVRWSGGTAPTLSTAPGAVDVLTFFTSDNGATWYGFVAGQAMA